MSGPVIRVGQNFGKTDVNPRLLVSDVQMVPISSLRIREPHVLLNVTKPPEFSAMEIYGDRASPRALTLGKTKRPQGQATRKE